MNDPQPPTLLSSLVSLSEAVAACYDVALDTGHNEVATELVLIAHHINTLLPKALKRSVAQNEAKP